MALRPQRKTQAASLASYAICSDLRAKIRLRWRTTRRRSSPPRRRPSLQPPSRNTPRWQRRKPIRPNSEHSRRIRKLQLLSCPSRRRSDRRALNRRARPRARRLPCSVARRRPSPSEASTIASTLRVKPDRRTWGLRPACTPARLGCRPLRQHAPGVVSFPLRTSHGRGV